MGSHTSSVANSGVLVRPNSDSPALRHRAASGLEREWLKPYFFSEYTRFVLPIYCLELLRQLSLQWLGADQFCESFLIVARKPSAAPLELANGMKPELAGVTQ